MAGIRRFIKVFLGSPGDLVEERRVAKAVIEDFNSQLAGALGYQVELVGWEDTLPGVGRPQAIINRDLDGCDLFVGMLWKRWGTPPGTEPFTSGFEEEFQRSLARNGKEGKPEIHLLLKEIDESALADPGEHLKRVIEFKKQVFAEKKLLAGSFGDIRDFEVKFRRCIQGFVIALFDKNNAPDFSQDHAPAIGTQGTPENVPGPSTPLSAEGAKFLRIFLSKADQATDERPLAADDVARVRLLAGIAAVHGNDPQSLGTHDSNLLFKAHKKFDFGRRELQGLVENGLAEFKTENVPLWHWVAALEGFNDNFLPIRSVVGPSAQRVGALKAMCLISEPIIEEGLFGRKDVISHWFVKGTDLAVRVAALEYLAECGQPADLGLINEEFARNETQTAGVAADAIIRILLRDDRGAALSALYTLAPGTVSPGLLDAVFAQDAELDDDVLKRGLSHRNDGVRMRVAALLRKRGALSVTIAEPLLKDSNVGVRFEALQALVSSGQRYSTAQAKEILVRTDSGRPGLGLFSFSEVADEATLREFTRQYFDGLAVEKLEEEDRLAVFDQDAYFALVRRDLKRQGGELRKAVLNQFADRFESALTRLGERIGADFVEKTRVVEKSLRSQFTREGLDIICNQLEVSDLPLVRQVLESGNVNYSTADLRYLRKFGQWRDISLVIASLDRPEFGKNRLSLLVLNDGKKYNDAARVLYDLGKHRLRELLVIPMPYRLLVCIIRLISEKSFHDLSRAVINSLFHSESDDVRRVAAQKFVRAFSLREIKDFLGDYMAADQFYYNVVHWLDFGVSVPRTRSLRALRTVLAAPKNEL